MGANVAGGSAVAPSAAEATAAAGQEAEVMARVPLAAGTRAADPAARAADRTEVGVSEMASAEVEARVWVPAAVGHRAAATEVEVMVATAAAKAMLCSQEHKAVVHKAAAQEGAATVVGRWVARRGAGAQAVDARVVADQAAVVMARVLMVAARVDVVAAIWEADRMAAAAEQAI